MTPRMPRFQEGQEVIRADAVDRVKRSFQTVGGQWLYYLESGKVAEEALLRALPVALAKPAEKPQGPREPGQEG